MPIHSVEYSQIRFATDSGDPFVFVARYGGARARGKNSVAARSRLLRGSVADYVALSEAPGGQPHLVPEPQRVRRAVLGLAQA